MLHCQTPMVDPLAPAVSGQICIKFRYYPTELFCLDPQCPFQTGVRFSAKASGPSRASSDARMATTSGYVA